MDKTTMGVYGWILITLMCMSVLMGFATPLGQYAMEQVNYTLEDWFDKAFEDESDYALDKPALAISDTILTVTPVENATAYEVYVGMRLVETLTDTYTVDLSKYTSNTGFYVIKVVATSSQGYSDTAAIGYTIESVE